ncbi:transporter [Flavobacterium frigidimaris]|uniref:MetA-pathway of phenol degradation n=1 Tax=Flavobacterium frigidimaris TaxID=262320 RepID=A0ABX4BWA5_FLAFR|nr:transporter [Flavobacterium frigidimaris]OXA82049.1 hypothetical protein B0A65_01425 [Flavobacterium frigidimaris]
MKLIHLIILSVLLSAPYFVQAQQIQTDRPTETESTSTISAKHLQMENGISYEKNGDEKIYEMPEVVLRYGLFKNAEIRMETAFKISNDESENLYGIKPVTFGFKYHVIDHKGLAPDIAVLGRLSIPWMADNSLQEQNYSPEIRVLFQHELSKKTHVSYNMGIEWLAENASPEYIYTLSVDHAVSKKCKVFIETYGFAVSHEHAENNADAGVLYLLSKNLQLDFMAGTSLMNAHPKKFAEIGLSFKI